MWQPVTWSCVACCLTWLCFTSVFFICTWFIDDLWVCLFDSLSWKLIGIFCFELFDKFEMHTRSIWHLVYLQCKVVWVVSSFLCFNIVLWIYGFLMETTVLLCFFSSHFEWFTTPVPVWCFSLTSIEVYCCVFDAVL